MTGHARWDELAAGYALSALEPEDEEEFARHLRGCSVCERTVAELSVVVGELAYGAEPADPPPALLASLREGIATSERPALTVAGAPPRRRPVVSRQWVLTAAASLVILVLGLWNAVLRSDSGRKDDVIALRRQFEQLVADPASSRVELAGEGKGVAVVRDGRVMLLLDDLAVSTGPEIYVLWALDASGRPTAVQGFEVTNADDPNLIPEMRLPGGDVTALAISREPGPAPPPAPSRALLAGTVGA